MPAPASDRSARGRDLELQSEVNESPLESLADTQTSVKSGKHSTVEKLAASRSDFSPRSSAGPVAGAFGDGEPMPAGTGEFRCGACGRYFDSESDLRNHETECRVAKIATGAGAEELESEDRAAHAPNDRDR